MEKYDIKTNEEYENEIRFLIGRLSNEKKNEIIRFLYVCVRELMKNMEP